jgi:hypothetical protein
MLTAPARHPRRRRPVVRTRHLHGHLQTGPDAAEGGARGYERALESLNAGLLTAPRARGQERLDRGMRGSQVSDLSKAL